ncbi:hypothetical protein [Sphingobacterium sp.]|uniref:hypothetical protein n=1 Tax=Sphingobacterium sp. TaxID=341027 RepID=UPI0028A0EB93|nr:hypothetical protein [Sphingobacterium sp.]
MKHYIPPQREGKQLDIKESSTFDSASSAKGFYKVAKDRMLNINQWFEIASLPASTFKHLNPNGQQSSRLPEHGDYIKIDIPGPGLSSTCGFDYVRIETLEETQTEEVDTITMTVRPSEAPGNPSDQETKHFFKNVSTSTFQIKRTGNLVEACYYGRNEVINLDLSSLLDRFRNLVVAIGAKLGGSYPQWKSLIAGFIKK